MPALIPAVATYPYTEHLVWDTEILRGGDRSPQRISLRKIPRQQVTHVFALRSDAEAARLDHLVHRYAKGLWYLPLWAEAVARTASLAAGSTTVAVDTTNAGFQSDRGNYALIYQTPTVQEIVTVSAVAAGSLTVSAVARTYSGLHWIVPCRTAYLSGSPHQRRYVSGAALWEMTFEAVDNDYVTGHSYDQEYDNCGVVTDPAGTPGGVFSRDTDPDVIVLDSRTGRRTTLAGGTFNDDTQTHQFVHQTRADCWKFRQWLHWLNGAQKSFLVPTFRDDLTLAVDCSAVATTITVTNCGLGDYLTWQFLRYYVAFPAAGGGIVVRRVDGITELSATQERLTLDAAPGAAFAAGTHLSWVERCTLAGDGVQIQWRRRNVQTADVSVRRVTNYPTIGGVGLPGLGIA